MNDALMRNMTLQELTQHATTLEPVPQFVLQRVMALQDDERDEVVTRLAQAQEDAKEQTREIVALLDDSTGLTPAEWRQALTDWVENWGPYWEDFDNV